MKKERERAMILVLGFMFFALGGLMIFVAIWVWKTPETIRFSIGQCVVFDAFRERWQDPPTIMKIAEVGQRSYRVLYLRDGQWVGSSTINFDDARFRPVDCSPLGADEQRHT